MKARSKIIYIIVIILLVTLIVNKYYQKQQKYEEYVNEKLNWNFYKICDYMMNSNAIIENTVENGYILQSDLEYLKDQYFYYIRSLDEVNDISRKFYKFNFFSVEKLHNFSREYSSFYYRIDDLFENKEYDAHFTLKHQLTNSDLDVFRQSYEYTSRVVGVIKNYIEYYNMFDIVIIEDKATGINQLKKEFKEEYLELWPDNKVGSSVEMSINEDGTVVETSAEVPRYDYPQKPFIRVKSKEWINILKEVHSLNINKEG